MIPSAFEQIAAWREQRERRGHLLLALDFDGTISPIVERPQDAAMLPAARSVIERLVKRADTDVAIVSGRSLEDLRERCAITGVYYSGNHGLQIEGPGVHQTRPDAVALLPAVRRIARELDDELAGMRGVFFEDKELTLSVHTRMIDDEREREQVHRIVEEAVATNPHGLRLTYGKRVIEIRPEVDWHKGQATLFLIDCVEKARASQVYPMFIGDDVTDEDAFAAIRERGAGVLVADAPTAPTAARAWVRTPEDVVLLLRALAE